MGMLSGLKPLNTMTDEAGPDPTDTGIIRPFSSLVVSPLSSAVESVSSSGNSASPNAYMPATSRRQSSSGVALGVTIPAADLRFSSLPGIKSDRVQWRECRRKERPLQWRHEATSACLINERKHPAHLAPPLVILRCVGRHDACD